MNGYRVQMDTSETTKRLSDYPPGIQDLLKWAGYHLEQLDILECEFRAWQNGFDKSLQLSDAWDLSQEQPPTPTRAERLQLMQTATRAEAAHLRWTARGVGNKRG